MYMRELTTNEQRMSSVDIAAVAGKMHKDVLKAIRNMEPAWEKVHGRKFALVDYTDAKGERRPCFSLTKTECLYVATKFNDEARARLVLRWEELERERLKSKCVRHLLVSDADVMHEAERLVARELERDNQKADGCVTTTDIARTVGMETRDLLAFLTDRGVLYRRRGRHHLTDDYEGRGLAQPRLFVYYSKDGKQKKQTYLVWTTKGAEMINKMIRG
jgi:phage regulator Rha-like protein